MHIKRLAPRVLLAGVSSGCGKTTVTCAVLQAFVNRGIRLHAFKCGPDYIDPMFHENVIGARGSNLDLFFYDANTLRYLVGKHAHEAELSVMEGVMGYYDGSFNTTEKSTYEVAAETGSPVILVINGRGMTFSVTAVIRGFLETVPDSRICGVILNQVSPAAFQIQKQVIEEQFGEKIKVFGYLPVMKDCSFESRHLGLVTAGEIEDIKEKLNRLAAAAEQYIDLDGIVELANKSEPLEYEETAVQKQEKVRIAVALDRAFCFYYRDNLELLSEMGAELCYFSPLKDTALPECDALYLGGGYPELYLERLAENKGMRDSVKNAVEAGLPCIAECGGFMYLTEEIEGFPMVGVLSGRCENKGRLVRFGYVTLTAREDNLLCRAGEQINAHEFHHYDAQENGHGFHARKRQGREWDCVQATQSLYAGYPHLPFYSNLQFAENFYKAAVSFKHQREENGYI